MKSRMTLISAALVVLLGAMVWVIQDRNTDSAVRAAMPEQAVAIRVARAEPAATMPAATQAAVEAPAPSEEPSVEIYLDGNGEVSYVARPGDTISQLAMALLGSDSREHRDAVVGANPSLQSNPDLVLVGQPYSIARDEELSATAAAGEAEARGAQQIRDGNATLTASGPKLKYTAQPGDTVRTLAANLLGGDTKVNRKSIVARNPSLLDDADHMVAGRSYTIWAPNGLAADPDALRAKLPAIQPDADDLTRISVGRVLRYTARPGDTVSKLAIALLGSDTPENHERIIRSNLSLKLDPDHLIAGRTYWIVAPRAD